MQLSGLQCVQRCAATVVNLRTFSPLPQGTVPSCVIPHCVTFLTVPPLLPSARQPLFDCCSEFAYCEYFYEWNHKQMAFADWLISPSTLFPRLIHLAKCSLNIPLYNGLNVKCLVPSACGTFRGGCHRTIKRWYLLDLMVSGSYVRIPPLSFSSLSAWL